MLLNKQIIKIIKQFYNNNKTKIHLIFIISNTSFFLNDIILPSLMAKLISNINNKELVKSYILKIIFVFMLANSFYSVYESYHNKIDPTFESFITDIIIDNIFIKFENTNKKLESSIIFNKIVQIKRNLVWMINKTFFYILPRLISLIMTNIKMFYINKTLMFNLICVLLIQLYFSIININKCIDKSYDEINTNDNIIAAIEDKLYNIDTINNTYDGINNEIINSKKLSNQLKLKRFSTINCVFNKQQTNVSITSFSYLYLLLFTSNQFENNLINGEQLIDIIITIDKFFNQVGDICYFIPEIITCLGILQNNEQFIKDLFEYVPTNGKDINVDFNSITIDNLSFKYNNNYIINSFSKKIKSNTITAIFGKSGSGKSTLVKLICNILKPTSGSIFFDGVNINDIPKDLIKKNIFFINQESNKLFNDTVSFNMCYGMNPCNIDKIKSILINYKLLNVFNNINKNNDPFFFLNFNVGKTGEYLSGGQKQLIHLIRSILYNKSKIIILDEPTSALDIETRDNVLKLIKDNSHNKIIIIITHDNYVKNFCNDVIYIGE